MKANGTTNGTMAANGTAKNGKALPQLAAPANDTLWCGCPGEGHELDGGRCMRHGREPCDVEAAPPPAPAAAVGLAVGLRPAAEGTDVRHVKIVEMEQRLSRARRTITEWYRKGDFPKPHYCGPHRCWYLHEVEAWEAKRPKTRPGAPPPGPAH